MSIEILLNGEKKEIHEGITLADLITELNLIPERLAVEYNARILKRANWEKTLIASGDKIEIVHLVGGGGTLF